MGNQLVLYWQWKILFFFGEGALSLQGNAVFYAIVSEPTSDTDRMMNEVGALVHDLQTMGDMAVSKWKN